MPLLAVSDMLLTLCHLQVGSTDVDPASLPNIDAIAGFVSRTDNKEEPVRRMALSASKPSPTSHSTLPHRAVSSATSGSGARSRSSPKPTSLHGSLEVASELVHLAQHAVTEAAALSSSVNAVAGSLQLASWCLLDDGSQDTAPAHNQSGTASARQRHSLLLESAASGCPIAALASAPQGALILAKGDISAACDTRAPNGHDVLLGRLVAGGWGPCWLAGRLAGWLVGLTLAFPSALDQKSMGTHALPA